jgi:hypothetical protein
MDAEMIAKLEEIKYRATRYEVVAVVNGKTATLGFTANKTKAKLLDYSRRHLPKMITVNETTAVLWDKTMKRYTVEGQDVYVEFSGRTQRDFIIAGE